MKFSSPSTSLIVCVLLICINPVLYAQKKSLRPMEGYKEILVARFSDQNLWFKEIECNLNSLLNVAIRKENMDLLIPLKSIEGSDTLIIFCYSKDIKKMARNQPVKFNDGLKFKNKAVKEFYIRDLPAINVSYDSIYQYMTTNMLINTSLFDMDKFLDSDISNYCCRVQGFNQRLRMIYLFYLNGILIREDNSSGELLYLPY